MVSGNETVTGLQFVLLILCFIIKGECFPNSDAVLMNCLESDREALLDFKNGLHDPENRLSSWKGSNCCPWWGISCENSTGAVIGVDLHNPYPQDAGFSGTIPPRLGSLSNLQYLDVNIDPSLSVDLQWSLVVDDLEWIMGIKYTHERIIVIFSSFGGYLVDLEGRHASSSKSQCGIRENRLSSCKGRNCCQWRGISCENRSGAVTAVDLHNPYAQDADASSRYGFWNLSGEIRPSLTKLKSLRYLDLSFNSFGVTIPEFFGSLENLQYLNLSGAGFWDTIPPSLGNLSSLHYLDLKYSWGLYVENLEWLKGLVSPKHLSMSGVDLSMAGSDWIEALNKLPSLTELDLSSCLLSGSIPPLTFLNLTSLSVVDLSFNGFKSKIPDWFVNISSLISVDLSYPGFYGRIPLGFSELPNLQLLNLAGNKNLTASCYQLFNGKWDKIQVLDLSGDRLHGKLLASFGNMTSLTHIDLVLNNVEGGIPSSIGKLCNLEFFLVSGNNLTGTLPGFLEGKENCPFQSPLPSLKYLDLPASQLVANLPEWLGQLENLVELNLYNNSLNGTLPESLGNLSELSLLDVSSNHLTGILTGTNFLKYGKLKHLFLSSNSFILNVSSNWVPLFQVQDLDMGSCHIGPSFPAWLRTQKQVTFLDFSNASTSGTIPTWFWDISFNLTSLNVFFNQLEGQLPSPLKLAISAEADFSSNLLDGPMPMPLPNGEIELVDLSNNKFSGHIPQNIGDYPPPHFNKQRVIWIDGDIPASLGKLLYVQAIDLSDNNLSGSIPPSIGDCSYLMALDIRGLSNLSSLQVLDLAENQFNGSIPGSFGDLKAMTQVQNTQRYMFFGTFGGSYYEDYMDVNTKGQLLRYTKTLSLVISLDLSGNNLSGTLPGEVTTLLGLVVLNLSRNHISGHIPESISKLKQLSSPDLSSNRLSGGIPKSLASLSFLGYLNLSNNDVSGRIPYTDHMTTFDASSFAGNLGLCGTPPAVKCPGDGDDDSHEEGTNANENSGSGESLIDRWFYLSVGLGFAAGILVPCFILAVRKSWSDAYFGFIDDFVERRWFEI
ncbi:hypothetical protein FNV43_RR20091 [Rhamnella rubrinervis]|uniref:Leucine-rich repeat-containing N-terminal plant-type domain-containing protein n=1 Tax=Rhamnella rubrinervis TaxID=2594499 RepID=A0A8K0GU97_9ROSA|nr:hypothetical protein FNV43_RR20091 [Rhamnella rubrinervis]